MMHFLSNAALGTAEPEFDYRPLLWAFFQHCHQANLQVQSFHAQARIAPADAAAAVCERPQRHLDSWLMSPDLCRHALLHGSRGADLALVDGRFGETPGGSLDLLCQWLDLPRWLVIDVSESDPCRVPPRPERVDGVFLSGVAHADDAARQACRWEALWGAPVLGCLMRSPHLWAIVQRLPAGSRPSRDVCRALGESLHLQGSVENLLLKARRQVWNEPAGVFSPAHRMRGLRVALAYDSAFQTHFPDTLDVLELSGAHLIDFSPIHDEELPADTDVVYLSAGHPERFAESLSANPCMISALRRHATSGKRVYAEGGGLAYLCSQMELADGRRIPMTGLMPAIARQHLSPPPPAPAEVTLAADCWLGQAGHQLRGYRDNQWRIEPLGPIETLAQEPHSRFDLMRHRNVIGSQLQLSLVAQPDLLEGFLAVPASATAFSPR